jgi:uncharacterized protein YkwD
MRAGALGLFGVVLVATAGSLGCTGELSVVRNDETDGGLDAGIQLLDGTFAGRDAGSTPHPGADAGRDGGAAPEVDAGSEPVCGNGRVEAGESCDPPSSCPTSCPDDGVACTTARLVGDAASCTAACEPAPVACGPSDGCCPGGCSTADDVDCDASCGDGVCSGGAGETCTGCPDDCDTTEVVCGNGACEGGETSASCYGDCGPATWPSEWLAFEEEVLGLLNDHRAAGTDCPDRARDPVGPLTMQSQLRRAAQLHSWDMAYSDYRSHTSCNGRSFGQRAAAQGVGAFAEILVYGSSSPAGAVAAWMGSSGHCNIIMDGRYDEIGVGYAVSDGVHRWTGKLR